MLLSERSFTLLSLFKLSQTTLLAPIALVDFSTTNIFSISCLAEGATLFAAVLCYLLKVVKFYNYQIQIFVALSGGYTRCL